MARRVHAWALLGQQEHPHHQARPLASGFAAYQAGNEPFACRLMELQAAWRAHHCQRLHVIPKAGLSEAMPLLAAPPLTQMGDGYSLAPVGGKSRGCWTCGRFQADPHADLYLHRSEG